MSQSHDPAASTATLAPGPAQPLPHSGSSNRLPLRIFAAIIFLLSLAALGISVYRRVQQLPPDRIVETFLQALLQGDTRTAARYLSKGEKSDLAKIGPLQLELQSDSAHESPFTIQVKTQKITTSRAIVDATLTRNGDSLPLQFLLEPSSATGWIIRDIQNPDPQAEKQKPDRESPEQKELRERLIHDLSRGGQTPVETEDP
ncbi:MAG: hypothetical protein U0903_19345 [Planctomycetales bacterium]